MLVLTVIKFEGSWHSHCRILNVNKWEKKIKWMNLLFDFMMVCSEQDDMARQVLITISTNLLINCSFSMTTQTLDVDLGLLVNIFSET